MQRQQGLDADWAWAAGLFEGEGCITRTTQPSYRPRLTLGMTDQDVVRRFHGIVGCGGVYRQRQRADHKPMWKWECTGRREIALIAAMFWPWLGGRRKSRFREVLGFPDLPLLGGAPSGIPFDTTDRPGIAGVRGRARV